jgi:hypothetical protein
MKSTDTRTEAAMSRWSGLMDRLAGILWRDCGKPTTDYIGPNGGAICNACAIDRAGNAKLIEARPPRQPNPPPPPTKTSEDRLRDLERRVSALEAANGRIR